MLIGGSKRAIFEVVNQIILKFKDIFIYVLKNRVERYQENNYGPPMNYLSTKNTFGGQNLRTF